MGSPGGAASAAMAAAVVGGYAGAARVSEDDRWLIQRCLDVYTVAISCEGHSAVTDVGIQALARADKLRELSLAGCTRFQGESLEALVRCGELRSLDLTGCSQLTPDHLKRVLTGLTKLESLHLKGTKATVSILPALSRLGQLRVLEVDEAVELDPAGLQRVAQALLRRKTTAKPQSQARPASRVVEIRPGENRLQALKRLEHDFPEIETLSLAGPHAISLEEAEIINRLSRLTSLRLSNCTLAPQTAGFLPKGLQSLSFISSSVDGATLSQLPPSLLSLSMRSCPHLDPSCISLINASCPMLTSLEVDRCGSNPMASWQFPLEHLENLSCSHPVSEPLPIGLIKLRAPLNSFPEGRLLRGDRLKELALFAPGREENWNRISFSQLASLDSLTMIGGTLRSTISTPETLKNLSLEGVRLECLYLSSPLALDLISIKQCKFKGPSAAAEASAAGYDPIPGAASFTLDDSDGFPHELLASLQPTTLSLRKITLNDLDWMPATVEKLSLVEIRGLKRLELRGAAALRAMTIDRSDPSASPTILFPEGLEQLTLLNQNRMPGLPEGLHELITNIPLQDSSIQSFIPKQLRALILEGPQRYTDAGLAYLPKNLEVFQMGSEVNISDHGMQSLPKTLRRVSLPKTCRISGEGVSSLPTSLEFLDLSGLPIPTIATAPFREAQILGRSGSSTDEEMQRRLQRRVVGQERAIEAALPAIRRMQSPHHTPGKPVSVLLFAGPTGVGKTELAQSIADEIGSPLVRLDMSEYSSEHSVSNLNGGAKNYVGSTDGGALTLPVYRKPKSVVLLDEIEKANPAVLKSIMNVLDAARMEDTAVGAVDFSKCLIIMTSNLGAEEMANMDWEDPATFDQASQSVQQLLKRRVAPEFVGRVRETISFRTISAEHLLPIVSRHVRDKGAELSRQFKLTLFMDPTVWEELPDDLDLKLGARPIVNRIVEELEIYLGSAMEAKMIKAGDRVVIRRHGGALVSRKAG